MGGQISKESRNPFKHFSRKRRDNDRRLVAIDPLIYLNGLDPNPEDRELYKICEEVINEPNQVLEELRKYQGSTSQIRRAISKRTVDVEREALNVIRPGLCILVNSLVVSRILASIVYHLLSRISFPNPDDGIIRSMALVGQLCKIMAYVLEYDDSKLRNPEIQNDFSYYRRTEGGVALEKKERVIPIDIANQISFFLAVPNPMFSTVAKTLQNPEEAKSDLVNFKLAILALQSKSPEIQVYSKMIEAVEAIGTKSPIDSTVIERLGCIAKLANSLLFTIKTRQDLSKKVRKAIRRNAVFCILLYDHLNDGGIFMKHSEINLKDSLEIIRMEKGEELQRLLNLLRFGSKTINSEAAPKKIKKLLIYFGVS